MLTTEEVWRRLSAPLWEPFRLDADCDEHLVHFAHANQFLRAVREVAPDAIRQLGELLPMARMITNVSRPEFKKQAIEGGCLLFPFEPEKFIDEIQRVAGELVRLSRDVLNGAIVDWAYRYNLVVWPHTMEDFAVWESRDVIQVIEASCTSSRTAFRRMGQWEKEFLRRWGDILVPHRRVVEARGAITRVAGRWVLRAIVRRFVRYVLGPQPCPLHCERWRPPWRLPELDHRYLWLARSQVLRESAQDIGAWWAEEERRRLGRSAALRAPARRTIEEAVKRLRERLDLPQPEPLKRGPKPRPPGAPGTPAAPPDLK